MAKPLDLMWERFPPRDLSREIRDKRIYELCVLSRWEISDAFFKLTYFEALQASCLAMETPKEGEAQIRAILREAKSIIWDAFITPRCLAFLCTRFRNLHDYEDMDWSLLNLDYA